MMKFAVLLTLVVAATADPIPRPGLLSSTSRIVGGVDTTIEQVPYQVTIQVLGSHFCGGSIISDTWILSAAHCFIYPDSWYTVRSGSTFWNSGGTVTPLTQVINHEGYTAGDWGMPLHDFSLVQLSTPLTLGPTQAIIPMYESGQEAVPGSPAVSTGWGSLAFGEAGPIILQTITIPIVSKTDCNTALSFLGGLPEDQICAGVSDGSMASCSGDSGGPLAIDGVLAGVVSYGTCGSGGFPTVYAEVSTYRSWINTHSGL